MKKKHGETLLEFKEIVKNEQLDLDCIIWSWKVTDKSAKDTNNKVIKAILKVNSA